MSKELKPCPFCGGEAKIIENNHYTDIHSVMCKNCFSETDRYHTQEEAMAQWNKRKPIKKIVEELEEKVELAHKRYVDCPVNSPCYERYRTQYNERRMCLDIVKGGGVNDD